MQECLKEEERWKIEELSWLSGCHCFLNQQLDNNDNDENSLNSTPGTLNSIPHRPIHVTL